LAIPVCDFVFGSSISEADLNEPWTYESFFPNLETQLSWKLGEYGEDTGYLSRRVELVGLYGGLRVLDGECIRISEFGFTSSHDEVGGLG
jgi:hypothetical protein